MSTTTEAGFTKTVSQKPAHGDQRPFSLVEFSLTNEVRADLQKALQPYVDGEITDKSQLGRVIKDNMPPEVLEELQKINRKETTEPTVYVIHNLPELSRSDIKERVSLLANRESYKDLVKSRSFATFIGAGLYDALDINYAPDRLDENKPNPHPLVRMSSDRVAAGSVVHKDENDVSGLSGIISSGNSATHFADWDAILKDAQSAGLSDLLISGPDRRTGPLGKFATRHPNWKKDNGFNIALVKKDDTRKEQFTELLNKHSYKVEAQPGDLVLWSNYGNIVHWGTLGAAREGDDISRAVIIHSGFRR